MDPSAELTIILEKQGIKYLLDHEAYAKLRGPLVRLLERTFTAGHSAGYSQAVGYDDGK